MKESIFTVAVLLLTFASAPAFAVKATCNKSITQGICYSLDYTFTKVTASNCATTSHFCWGSKDVTECASCNSGYTLTYVSLTDSTYCTNSITYKTCNKTVVGGNGCGTACLLCRPAIGSWTNVSGYTGYLQQSTTKCDESTNCECVRDYEYKCAAGYYGASPSCTTITNVGTSCSGCSECPDVPGKVDWVDESYSITSAAGSTIVTQCYIDGTASDHYIADQTGHYTIVGGKCYYRISF